MTAASTPRDDLEKLVREMLAIAKEALEERGSFPPFGGGLLPDGGIKRIAATEAEQPAVGADAAAWLDAQLRGGAAEEGFRATVAVVNVQVRPPGRALRDAVQVKLDHSTGVSLELFFPYRLKRPGLATFGRAFSREGDAEIFD